MQFNIALLQGKIQGVVLKKCDVHPDNRGSFSEVFCSEWVPGCNYRSEIQLNLSRSRKNALRGLHFHYRQNDWWMLIQGKVQTVLADLRKNSPTFGKTMVFTMTSDDSVCVLIPPGVAHGFLALEDVSLLYAVDRYYDGTDEQGVAWNDPALAVPWLSENPVVSRRDMNNPSIKELELEKLLPR